MRQRIGRGRRGGLAAWAGVVAWLVGVAALGPSPATAAPSEWTVVVSEKTGGGDPLSEYGTNTMWTITQLVLEPLLRIELLPDGKSWGVVNHLAERWSFPDEKTFLVTLKKGVKFQNGEELTAEHVKVAYDALVSVEKPTRTAVIVKPLGACEVVDRYTVRWRLAAPGVSVLGSLEYMAIPPLARKAMTREQFEAKPVGTGPYRVVDWPRDGTVRLEAWDGFRGGKPTPEKLVFRYVPEPSTRVFELTAGTAQIAETIPIEAVASIQANPRLQVASLKGSLALSYVINIFKTNPPLRDRRVRQAMNYAVDREAIVKAILGGRGTALPGPLWPGHLGYSPDVTPYHYDPEKAKALLKEAGYPDGFAFKWTVTQGVVAKDIEVAQAVANQLAKVGIKATLQPSERARLLAERNEGGYDVTELVWTMSWNPAVLFQFTLMTSYPDAKLGAPPDELVKLRELMKEGAAATTIEQAGSTYARLNRLMHEDALWLFVNTLDQLWGVQKDTGWRPYPVAFQRYNDYWAMTGRKAPESPDVPLILK